MHQNHILRDYQHTRFWGTCLPWLRSWPSAHWPSRGCRTRRHRGGNRRQCRNRNLRGRSERASGFIEPSQQSVILAADGSEIARFYLENRIVVSSDQISQHLKDAAVSIEDRRFYEHRGVDVPGLMRAVIGNVTNQSRSGGSSITQQYVKNALIEQGRINDDQELIEKATDRTIGRKINEARYAIAIEQTMAKDDILTGYLNLSQFGPSVYGVEAAAQHYFTTSAANLTVAQAAMIARNYPVARQVGPGHPPRKRYPAPQFRPQPDVLARLHQPGRI